MLHEAEMLEGMDVVERQGHRLLQDEEPWPASWCVPPRQQGRLRHTEKQRTDCKEEVSGCVKGGRWKVLAPRLSRHTPELGNSTCHGQLFVPFYSQWKRVRPVLQHSRQHSHQSPRASSISICLHKCSNPIHRQLCPQHQKSRMLPSAVLLCVRFPEYILVRNGAQATAAFGCPCVP